MNAQHYYSAHGLVGNVGQAWNFFNMIGLLNVVVIENSYTPWSQKHHNPLNLTSRPEFDANIPSDLAIRGFLPDGRLVRMYNVTGNKDKLDEVRGHLQTYLNSSTFSGHGVAFLANTLNLDIVGHYQVDTLFVGGTPNHVSGAAVILKPVVDEGRTFQYTVIEVLNMGKNACHSNEIN